MGKRLPRFGVAAVVALSFASLFGLASSEKRHKEVRVYSPVNDSEWQLNCSREKARLARGVLKEFLLPHLQSEGLNFTEDCPLHPTRDFYYEHEEHKVRYRKNYWKSLYSDKIFKSEYYADKHMENRHMDKIPETADTCLADFCDVFLCDEYAYMVSEDRVKQKTLFTMKPCSEEKMAASSAHCAILADTCFNVTKQTSNSGRIFNDLVCGSLTCDNFHNMLTKLNRKRPNRFRALYIASLIMAFLFLASYYLIVFLMYAERRQKPDLRKCRKPAANSTAGPASLFGLGNFLKPKKSRLD